MSRFHAFSASALVGLVVLVSSTRHSVAATVAPADACSLLTTAEVSAALEVTSLAGTHPFGNSPKACMWSDVANAGPSNRRVTLSLANGTAGFDMMKSKRSLPIEAVTGIGDDAFYQSFGPGQTPMLRVKKGNDAIDLRILNGLKSKPFTIDQAKQKEATLAKAAVGRL